MLPKNMERINPSCSQESASHLSWASHSSSEGSPVRYGSPDSSKVSRSGKGCGLALPSRIQVQRTNASRAIIHFHVQFWFPGSVLAETVAGKSARATRSFHSIGIHQYF